MKQIADVEKQKRVGVMSKIGFVYYSNKSGIYTEREIEMIEALEKEYERLKEVEKERLENMRLLQLKIDKLMEAKGGNTGDK